MEEMKKSSRGFASMDPEKQRAIARKGGQSVPDEKRSFSQNPDLAARAGRKGGQSVNPAKRSFSRDHALASEAGRKGGHASHGGGAQKRSAPREERRETMQRRVLSAER
jgi:general stress protein YciG